MDGGSAMGKGRAGLLMMREKEGRKEELKEEKKKEKEKKNTKER